MKTFNTQVCTTNEQSKRLLELGLKKETADMVYTNASLPYNKDVFHVICKEYLQLHKEVNYEISPFTFIPAWSLHRLISLCEHGITINHHENVVTYNMCRDFYGLETIYDNLIDCIGYLINEGWFNKEYLEE